uniref:RNase H type-1 domain-containing protein n=1 Tax=Nicotiana tabacum TaxID=4097 RepID=A0A1S4D524_TOBAC|nr:PREDICTED: uncharacterized protein LOC107826081 [Nicotiana tabacum]
MKLNPEKYAFGIASEKFLGFLVSQRGIEVNPDQIKAIDGIQELLTINKQVQKLTGRIVALSRFIQRSSDRCHKFFCVLKQDNRLEWNPECVQALRELKAYLSSPPLLSKSEAGEQLLVYLSISEVAVSVALIRENKGSGLGLVLKVPIGEVIRQSIRCTEMTNNKVEYEAITAGLRLALKYGAKRLKLRCDSQLVVKQVIGTLQIKEQRLQKYQTGIYKLLPKFDECRLDQILRAQNVEVDGLAKLGAATKSITTGDKSAGTLLYDKKEAKKLRMQAARYNLLHSNLYKRTYGCPLVKCLGPN